MLLLLTAVMPVTETVNRKGTASFTKVAGARTMMNANIGIGTPLLTTTSQPNPKKVRPPPTTLPLRTREVKPKLKARKKGDVLKLSRLLPR